MSDETSQEGGTNSRYKHKACPETNRQLSKKKRACDIPTYIMDIDNAASSMSKPIDSKEKLNGSVIHVNKISPSTHDNDIESTQNIMKKQKDNDPLSWDYDSRRKFRNAREKERSCHINQQILELRTLLALGGFTDDSRESKSTILDKTANYIKHLQRQQHASQMERQHLIMSQSHILRTGGCEHDIGFPLQLTKPNLLLQYASQSGRDFYPSSHMQQTDTYGETFRAPEKMHIDERDYRFVFEACSVGIAISSFGGMILDCNDCFCNICRCSKQELLGMTVFHLLAKADLQTAYDQLYGMITEACRAKRRDCAAQHNSSSIILQGGIKVQHSTFSIGLVKGNDGSAKCLCISLSPGHLIE